MKLAVPTESAADEPRVAISPDSAKKLVALGFQVSIQAGAGERSRIMDSEYAEAGATVPKSIDAALKVADVVLRVRRPTSGEAGKLKKGAIVIAMMDPIGFESDIAALAKAKVNAFSMEFLPRITRAQTMDVLSSQANLAGYQAVIDAAEQYDHAMPMMMTAAGSISPAKVFVMGAGVAGLQAIATARRLGAVVTATDVRPAAKEQVESLGGKFIAVENDEFRQAETAAGYAKEMSDDYKKQQGELTASHIAKQDIVIATALIPGRPAPVLITGEMVETMKPGSIIIDLAVERGGNCPLSKPGKIVEHKGVKIVGYLNFPGRVAASASSLYARNLLAFTELFVDKENGKLRIDWEDELISATALTRDGKIIHPALKPEKAARPKKRAPAKKATPAKRTGSAKTATPKKGVGS